MNDAPVAELVQNAFVTAVRNFTPKTSAKFQKLLPFKDGIAELRRRGASYETIADFLKSSHQHHLAMQDQIGLTLHGKGGVGCVNVAGRICSESVNACVMWPSASA